ncbi:MAG TPA: DUF6600 domain-containing protein [Polyangiaceae bacterium]
MRRFRLLALLAVAAVAPFVAGCAEEDVEAQPAAYPQAPGATHDVEAMTEAQAMHEQVPPAPRAYSPPRVQYGAAPAAPPQDFAQGYGEDEGVGVDVPAPAQPGYGPEDQYADTDPSAMTDFRRDLDPYGSWMDDPVYGTVWVPSSDVVGQDFAPYQTAGHWTYDDDYTWNSDYDWGWIPFHYGRWVYASGFGWGWIPGRRYAGAWVDWRYGLDGYPYIGWGPMAPTWGWRNGYAFNLGFVPREPYGFCGTRDLFSPTLHGVMVGGAEAGNVAAHTRPYVGASPTVNGRVAANPRVSGPSPTSLGIPASTIAHGGVNNHGVAQAQAFAHPSTARALGAHGPAVSSSRGYGSGGGLGGGRFPAYGSSVDSHFGGRLGYGFRGSASNIRPGYGYSLGSRPYYGPAPGGRPSFGGYRGGFGGGGGYGSGFGASRGFSPGFGMHPGVAPQGGSSHHSSYESSGGGYHGGGGHGGGGFRGGGGHGGGGRR